MNIAFIFSMYDEHDLIKQSISNIKTEFKNAKIYIIQSDDGSSKIPEDLEYFCKLPNLAAKYDRLIYPAMSICRNFSHGFSKVYADTLELDLIIALTGDTLIYDVRNFVKSIVNLMIDDKFLLISKAIGQNFHSQDNTGNIIVEARNQTLEILDFACCLFVLNAKFAQEYELFSNIPVVNKYCSEQCLGDSLLNSIGIELYHKHTRLLNESNIYDAYYFNNGIKYHAKNGRPGR